MLFPFLLALSGCAADYRAPSLSEDAGSPVSTDASTPDSMRDAGPRDVADAGDTPPPPPPARICATRTPGERQIELDSNGARRNAWVYVPEGLSDEASMLVLNFHGVGEDGKAQAARSEMIAAADTWGFIAVHPNGVSSSWNAGDCCAGPVGAPDDVAFIRDLLDALGREECFDERRVFATGMSNGALLAYRLACELSDRIAAIAPVAGALPVPEANCHPPRRVPVLHFHGTADLVVPYAGGRAFGAPIGPEFRSVDATLEHFRTLNGCESTRTISLTSGASRCETFACSEDGQIELCTLEGGGHTWPGGTSLGVGALSNDIDATNRMIEFFSLHSL